MSTPTRQRLVECAYELFARNGFHAIGLDRILDEAGVSKQTLYNHFDSKDDLILAVLAHRSNWEFESFRTMVEQVGGHDPRRQLEAIWDALDAWFNSPEFRGCIFITAAAEFPQAHDPAHLAAAGHSQRMLSFLTELAGYAGASDPQELARNLCLLMDGAIVFRHVNGVAEAARLAQKLAEPLLRAYLPPKAATEGKAASLQRVASA